MSKALKCDRCDKCFDPESIGDLCFTTFQKISYQNARDYKASKVTYVGGYDKNLCPDCTTEFMGWMCGKSTAVFQKVPERKMDKNQVDEATKTFTNNSAQDILGKMRKIADDLMNNNIL